MRTLSRVAGLLLTAALPLAAAAALPAEQTPVSINPEFPEHAKYSAVGGPLGNLAMIEAPEQIILHRWRPIT